MKGKVFFILILLAIFLNATQTDKLKDLKKGESITLKKTEDIEDFINTSEYGWVVSKAE